MLNQFIEVPATKKSLSHRTLVYGVGINNADYKTGAIVNGNSIGCPYYMAWKRMLERCYCDKLQLRHPTYIGCRVCDEWLIFTAFKDWMINQDWQGKHLDKDILKQGNKIYSPNTCLFVTGAINLLLNNRAASRGDYPQGVSFHKPTRKYQANCQAYGKGTHIGLFDIPELAHEAYKTFKYKLIAEIAVKQTEPLRSALLRYEIK